MQIQRRVVAVGAGIGIRQIGRSVIAHGRRRGIQVQIGNTGETAGRADRNRPVAVDTDVVVGISRGNGILIGGGGVRSVAAERVASQGAAGADGGGAVGIETKIGGGGGIGRAGPGDAGGIGGLGGIGRGGEAAAVADAQGRGFGAGVGSDHCLSGRAVAGGIAHRGGISIAGDHTVGIDRSTRANGGGACLLETSGIGETSIGIGHTGGGGGSRHEIHTGVGVEVGRVSDVERFVGAEAHNVHRRGVADTCGIGRQITCFCVGVAFGAAGHRIGVHLSQGRDRAIGRCCWCRHPPS